MTWNATEMSFLQGTNLYHATSQRIQEFESDHEQCRALFRQVNRDLGDRFTLERYLTAAIYLSSRAFPSTLLSLSPTLSPSPESPAHPVLLPILDCLNHARGQPVTWQVDKSGHPSIEDDLATLLPPSIQHQNIQSAVLDSLLKISIKIGTFVQQGAEVCNNYGPKPNAELILGYGFALPDNPDDTIILQLGGSARKWEIGRKGCANREIAIEGLFEDALRIVTLESKGEEHGSQASELVLQEAFEAKLDAGNFLLDAVKVKLGRLPVIIASQPNPEPTSVRGSVWEMIVYYVEGQRLCLLELAAYFSGKIDSITTEMASLGMSIEYEEDDDADEDEDE
ncbi:THO complex subunit 2 [Tulasnella sp. JGI-2019a]|nr:THO complex subunit 2 [Tulasnella sp. JGI-2019a]